MGGFFSIFLSRCWGTKLLGDIAEKVTAGESKKKSQDRRLWRNLKKHLDKCTGVIKTLGVSW